MTFWRMTEFFNINIKVIGLRNGKWSTGKIFFHKTICTHWVMNMLPTFHIQKNKIINFSSESYICRKFPEAGLTGWFFCKFFHDLCLISFILMESFLPSSFIVLFIWFFVTVSSFSMVCHRSLGLERSNTKTTERVLERMKHHKYPNLPSIYV